ncbi:MAG: gliding motility-associated C-terminal domain-containing protein [Bacteroidota bacterium]
MAQFAPDTLVCGDTLIAAFDPNQSSQMTDSFYVWIGNCPSQIKFDFTTANVPDAADIYYMDLAGNRQFAGSIPYFGGSCNGGNYFTEPNRFPPSSALLPQHCLPGFVELYGAGIPLQDSILQRNKLPTDFKLGGGHWESARLHLDIPEGIVAILFVVKFNPDESTVLRALWDCTPACCITALGDSLCVGDSLQLGTVEEALSYSWTGPNGFNSIERNPMIEEVEKSAEGWYVIEAEYPFSCIGLDSVYIKVNGPEVEILQGDSISLCLGGQISLEAQGSGNIQWDLSSPDILNQNGNQLIVSPQITSTYSLISTDASGCMAEANITVIPQEFGLDLLGKAPTCPGLSDGSISATPSGGQAPFEIRMLGGNWRSGTDISSLLPGNYQIEVRDAVGCIAHGSLVVEGAEPVSAALGVNPPSCTGSCDGELSLIPLEGQAPFSFFLNNEAKDSIINGLCADSYSLTVMDARGCSWRELAQIENPSPFEIDLGRNKKLREGKTLNLEIESSDRLAKISWPRYCEENCGENIEIQPDSSQWVYAFAENFWGCQAVDSVFVLVKKKAECIEGIYAPNAFSPNGDGLNERFTLYADQEETDVAHLSQLIILNRWGKVVWSKSSMPFNAPELGWDGYADGKKQPEGSYTWAGTFLREDGLSFSCGGSLILIR